MYEFGNVYIFNPEAKGNPEAVLAPYRQHSRLGIWMSGLIRQPSWARPAAEVTFYDLKAAVTNVLLRAGIKPVFKPAEVPANGIYSQALEVSTVKGALLGTLGTVNNAILRNCDIKEAVVYAELDWDAICRTAARTMPSTLRCPRHSP